MTVAAAAAESEAALPVVDLRSFDSVEDLAADLMRVGKDPGFFYVVGHELRDDVAADMFALAKSFFSSPLEEKLVYANGSGDLGYTGMREETYVVLSPIYHAYGVSPFVKKQWDHAQMLMFVGWNRLSGAGPGDVKESFYLSDPGKTTQLLPTELESRRETMAAFFAGCDNLAKTLLEGLAVGLGMPRDFLSKAHTGECCRMRLINYPPVSEVSSSTTTSSPPDDAPTSNSEDIRAGAHSDYGSLTLLFRQPSDQGGLQVLRGGGGGNKPSAWADVPCIPNAIVVNIGDALEFWTAGRLRSTVHRVAFPRSASENVARLSIPVFIQPDRHVVLAPIKEDRGDGGGGGAGAEFLEVLRRKGYESAEPVTSREHLERRIRATYGKA
ncbi:2OG-Fe(II)oxygenase superfamily protein [Colletotrichum paranaense]|uniref:2OG-Fe(II)oxygenase superfamily protein n=2 Tax=Colletotrichum acutatum species complex TaxID=2707335 RepID=A0ABQ9Q316_9PEZI|nr:2OG-Fe(II)oxygenase superfamily protein [Colletotrichum paranaense]KAK0378201.1 2OG-Fe(II)oxygenase superfamily protein [Colletotrichum limetticola]KAK1522902.1 2OG-Fe(II)oxygenase superfamily protein [Colletotrichum paranaense]